MKLMTVIAAIALSCLSVDAVTQVYRLERDTDSEALFLVGVDGVRRPVVVIEPEVYTILTDRVETVWKNLNANDSGRRLLHGSVRRTEIDEKDCLKRTVYADGYIHEERIPVKNARPRVVLRKSAEVRRPVKPLGISNRQWEMRKKVEKAKSGTPSVITVNRDATTGKDF